MPEKNQLRLNIIGKSKFPCVSQGLTMPIIKTNSWRVFDSKKSNQKRQVKILDVQSI